MALGEHAAIDVRGTLAVIDETTLTVPNEAHLKFDPGSTFKAGPPPPSPQQPKSGIVVATGGRLEAQGTSTAPVTFTSEYDNEVGKSVSTAHTPEDGDWAGITLEDAQGVTIKYADFRYAVTALNVGVLDTLTVERSDFARNQSDVKVKSTTDHDPALAALLCVRHTFGTQAIRRFKIHEVQRLMGHRHIRTTEIYLHYAPTRTRRRS